MLRKLFFLSLVCLFCLSTNAFARDKLKVVTTLSTFADLVRQIAGDYAEVRPISPGIFNPHFYEPKPSDILKTRKADLFVHAGLDLELWRFPLVDAAGNPDIFPGAKNELDLSKGISLLEAPQKQPTRLEGDIHIYGNPHYWVDPRNGKIMAENIAVKLKELAPEHSDYFDKNLNEFLNKLDEKITYWEAELKVVKGKEVVAYHNEWIYFTEFAGIKLIRYLEPKPGIPPTPKHLAFMEEYIKKNNIRGIIQPTYFPKDYSEALAGKVGVKVVILAQNVGEIPEANDYFSFFDFNVEKLKEAFTE
ncbi:MAG: metal ABC transporter substrate-binding protein [Candidatus Omnitrophota bacterium]|nr:metal ABC transporter substrate-binding protein [Candidatus Omnitrophota bacterium]